MLVSRMYSDFRGVDFRSDEAELARSPDSLNMWRDYKDAAGIRTRPAMALHRAFGAKVHSIWFLNGEMVAHCGNALYAVKDGQSVWMGDMADNDSHGFVYEGVLYILNGSRYIRYDGVNTSEITDGDLHPPYVPTTSIGRKPAGGGTTFEDVNMLSDYRINTFLGDGESTEFWLDAENIDRERPVVTVNGAAAAVYAVDYGSGMVILRDPPPAPLTDGQDNVVIKYRKHVEGYAEQILGCTMVQVFDNRVFVSGNPDYPNVVWHCSLNDPTYFSDLDYYREGMDQAKITGLVAGNNALWVFREPSDANTTVFYHLPTLDADYGKIYPSSHSSVTTGCVGKAINFNDDIVFFSQRGMEGISGDITTEQVLAHRSSLVDRRLTAEEGYQDMLLEEWEGYLLVIIGSKVYLADSRTAFNNEGHIEYEWFYWEIEKEVTCTKVEGGVLYLGTEDGVYTLTDRKSNVQSWWVTPKDKFTQPNKLKTTNKRGCITEATGDVTVYAKTEGTGFELIGKYENVTDYFACRIRQKKFKDIQLRFHSGTRFRLESATLECFVGGYIKR